MKKIIIVAILLLLTTFAVTRDHGVDFVVKGLTVNSQWVGADFAGIWIDGNAGATTINLVSSFEQIVVFDTDMPEVTSNGDNSTNNITVGATGTYDVHFTGTGESAAGNKTFQYYAFEIDASGQTITDITQATPAVVTAASHGFNDGDKIKITGVVGMVEVNTRIFTVDDATENTFSLDDDSDTDLASGGFTGYTSDGTATLATQLLQVHSHRRYSAGGGGDFGAFSGAGLVALTQNKLIELFVKGTTDATNFTFENLTLKIRRVN